MKRLFVSGVVLASAVALAQGGAAKKPAEGGAKQPATTKPAPAAPDVNRLPFTPDSIRQVVVFHMPQIQGCYEDTMATRKTKVEGKLLTAFTITPEGLVKDAEVRKKGTTLKEPGLHDCVVAVLTAMTFPKPPDGRDHPIEYPFNLKAIE
jgi:hypothetical protein